MAHAMPPALRRFAEFLAAHPSPTDVVAGRFYWVPCATHPHGKKWRNKWLHIPLLGTVHEDRDIINFKPWHIHIDTRFLTIPQAEDDTEQQRINLQALATPLSLTDEAFGRADHVAFWGHSWDNSFLSLRRLKARRAESLEWDVKPFWLWDLEEAYRDASAACGVCPHRQIPLSAGRGKGKGVRQCPGHGLCWDREGRLVRREVVA